MLIKKMKDSGVEWIGSIPKHWEVIKLKNKYKFITGFTPPSNSDKYYDHMYGYLWATISDLSKNEYIYETKNKVSGKYIEEYAPKIIPKGSFLYSFKLSIGEKGFAGLNMYTNEAIASFIKNENRYSIRFLYYSSFLIEYNCQYNIYGAKLLNQNLIRNAKVVFPPIKEQRKIANILDRKRNNLDEIILKTHQSIDELKKYKQSLITEVVTKGLNPNVEVKDSGIGWIGCIPEPWRITKLNQLFSIKKHIANKTGYDVLSVTQSGLRVRDITKNEGQMATDYSKYQIVEKDDFVMNHMDLLTGWIDIAQQQGVTSPDYRVFYNKQKKFAVNKYYLYVFQTAYINKIFYGLGQGVSNVGRWRLQTDKFLNFYVPLPSLDEQKEISSYLDRQTIEIDKLVENKESIIEELENYKKSLIYEYVTGKKEA